MRFSLPDLEEKQIIHKIRLRKEDNFLQLNLKLKDNEYILNSTQHQNLCKLLTDKAQSYFISKKRKREVTTTQQILTPTSYIEFFKKEIHDKLKENTSFCEDVEEVFSETDDGVTRSRHFIEEVIQIEAIPISRSFVGNWEFDSRSEEFLIVIIIKNSELRPHSFHTDKAYPIRREPVTQSKDSWTGRMRHDEIDAAIDYKHYGRHSSDSMYSFCGKSPLKIYSSILARDDFYLKSDLKAQPGLLPMTRNRRGESFLHFAARYSSKKICQVIVESNKDSLYVTNLDGWIPLFSAIYTGNLEVFLYLKGEMPPYYFQYCVERRGCNAFLLAILYGHTDIADCILKESKELLESSKDFAGKDALSISIRSPKSETYNYLLERSKKWNYGKVIEILDSLEEEPGDRIGEKFQSLRQISYNSIANIFKENLKKCSQFAIDKFYIKKLDKNISIELKISKDFPLSQIQELVNTLDSLVKELKNIILTIGISETEYKIESDTKNFKVIIMSSSDVITRKLQRLLENINKEQSSSLQGQLSQGLFATVDSSPKPQDQKEVVRCIMQ